MSRDRWRAATARTLALLVVAVAVLGAGAGYALGSVPRPWSSTSQVLVTGALGFEPNLDSALTRNQYVNQRMTTYAAVALSDLTADAATTRLAAAPGTLAGAIDAAVVPNTTIVALTVTGPTPEIAQIRGSAVTNALQEVVERTENLPGQSPRVRLTVLSRASLPDATAGSPSAAASASVGAGAGALLGVLAAFAFTVWARWPAIRRDLTDRASAVRRNASGAATSAHPPRSGRPAVPTPAPRDGAGPARPDPPTTDHPLTARSNGRSR